MPFLRFSQLAALDVQVGDAQWQLARLGQGRQCGRKCLQTALRIQDRRRGQDRAGACVQRVELERWQRPDAAAVVGPQVTAERGIGLEQRTLVRTELGRLGRPGDLLTQDAQELLGHFVGGLEACIGRLRGRSGQKAIQRFVRGKDRSVLWGRQDECVRSVLIGKVAHQQRQRTGDAVQVGHRSWRRRIGVDFGRGVPGGGEQVATLVVDAADGPEIDQLLDGIALAIIHHHHVLELHIHIDQPARVEVAEGRQDVQDVRDGRRHRQRPAVAASDLEQVLPVDQLHDDEALGAVPKKREHLDHIGMVQ